MRVLAVRSLNSRQCRSQEDRRHQPASTVAPAADYLTGQRGGIATCPGAGLGVRRLEIWLWPCVAIASTSRAACSSPRVTERHCTRGVPNALGTTRSIYYSGAERIFSPIGISFSSVCAVRDVIYISSHVLRDIIRVDVSLCVGVDGRHLDATLLVLGLLSPDLYFQCGLLHALQTASKLYSDSDSDSSSPCRRCVATLGLAADFRARKRSSFA